MGELEEKTRRGSRLESFVRVIGRRGLREEQAKALRQLERRLAKVEAGRGAQDSTDESRDAVEKPR